MTLVLEKLDGVSLRSLLADSFKDKLRPAEVHLELAEKWLIASQVNIKKMSYPRFWGSVETNLIAPRRRHCFSALRSADVV